MQQNGAKDRSKGAQDIHTCVTIFVKCKHTV